MIVPIEAAKIYNAGHANLYISLNLSHIKHMQMLMRGVFL